MVGACWLAVPAHAGASIDVRPLASDEADARKVGGVCDNRCSLLTIACPTPAAMQDWCTWPPGFRNTRSRCNMANDHGGGYACSAAANKRICQKFVGVECTPNGSANQTCGWHKGNDCNWTGAACVCPGLPANFDLNKGCISRDCSSP